MNVVVDFFRNWLRAVSMHLRMTAARHAVSFINHGIKLRLGIAVEMIMPTNE